MTVAGCLLMDNAVGGGTSGGILLCIGVEVLDGTHTRKGRSTLLDDDVLLVHLYLIDKEATESAVGT